MLSCKNCSIKKDWIDTHLNEYDSVLDACYDFIEFTKTCEDHCNFKKYKYNNEEPNENQESN